MIQIHTLTNGIRVVCEPIHYLHSVSLGVWINVGSIDETPETNGISHVIEHMLFKGTKTKSAKDIAKLTASIGGNLNAFTSKDCTSYYASTLDTHIEQAIALLGDMLSNPALSENDLQREKGVILEEIDMYDDSPEDMVHEMLHKTVWEPHSLGYIISGTKKTVKSFTREQLIDFINTYYIGKNIVISIAGNFQEAAILESLERHFGNILEGSPKKEVKAPVYKKAFYTKRQDIEQVHLDIAFANTTSVSMERYPFYIINSILGESVTSRLFQEIREEMGLTYTIYSYGSLYKQAGLFQIYAAMNPKQLPIVFDNIRRIVKDFTVDSITSEEIQNTVEELKTELILDSEGTHSRMENNAKSLLVGSNIVTIEDTIANISMVTKDDLDMFIKKYLKIEEMSYAVIGNLERESVCSMSL